MAAQSRNFELMMPMPAKSLREYEQHLIGLQRENFHLRLRMFYMQQHKTGGEEPACESTRDFEAFQQEMLGDLEKLVKEVNDKDALLHKNWLTIQQQHDTIEQLAQEKQDLEKELSKFQTKTNLAEAVYDDNLKMTNTVSQVEKQNKQLESDFKVLKQRLSELENVELPSLKRQVEKKTAALQNLSAHAAKQEKLIESLHSQKVLMSTTEPIVESFLQYIGDALLSGDIQAALAAKDKFRKDMESVMSMHRLPQQNRLVESSNSEGTLEVQLRELGAQLKTKENVIEGLNSEVTLLGRNLEACQGKCLDLEKEIERCSQMHTRICAEKDKLLESVQYRVRELENYPREVLTLKSRQAALERECHSLHAAVRDKTNFIEELLSERNAAICETEKSFHDLLHSMKQKDAQIDKLQSSLRSVEESAPVLVERSLDESTRQSLIHCSQEEERNQSETCEKQSPSLLEDQDGSRGKPQRSCSIPEMNNLLLEMDDLCKILYDFAHQTGLSCETIAPELLRLDSIRKLKELFKYNCEEGLGLVRPASTMEERTSFRSESSAFLCHTETEFSNSKILLEDDGLFLMNLGKKLAQICKLLDIESSPKLACDNLATRDIIECVDLISKKVREQNTEDQDTMPNDPEDRGKTGSKRSALLRGSVEAFCSGLSSLRNENAGIRSELLDFQGTILGELNPALECVVALREHLEGLSPSWKGTHSGTDKRCCSADEVFYAVNSSGRLVQLEGPTESASHGEKYLRDMSQQTDEPEIDIESLKNDLNKSKAQVKFLQRSLKDSFSVKITESPLCPSGQPLIEIDQNLPLPSPPSHLSPRKSSSSANRRWHKQLTNQKMSEFGLSENVFELQEEIFFLVLRIEDLERQLRDHPEVTAKRQKEELLHELSRVARSKHLDKSVGFLEQQQRLHQMQEMCTILLCRLEELATFLEQLLTGDSTLGSVTLSADVVAKMRQLIADSKDFSLSVSQSILGSDTSSVLSEHHSRRKSSLQKEFLPVSLDESAKGKCEGTGSSSSQKLDPKSIAPAPEDIAFLEDEVAMLREQVQRQQSEISTLTQHLEKERPSDASTSGMCKSPRRHPGTPASLCEGEDTDASWRYQDQVVLVQASDSDDILLLLNDRGLPENVYLRSTWEKQGLHAELPVCVEAAVSAAAEDADADYSSSSSLSLPQRKDTAAASANTGSENGAAQREEPLVAIGRFQCWSSDSDIWSEPDRSVSEQRMGGVCRKQFSKQPRRSPKGVRKVSATTSAASVRQEPGSDSVAKRAERWHGGESSKGKRHMCSTEGGRSKRSGTQSTHSEQQKLEKLLRRLHHCNGKLEDALGVHKEFCQKLLSALAGENGRDPSEHQPQLLMTELMDVHLQVMRKLQFKLEEMVINSEVLREILTEHLVSETTTLGDSKRCSTQSNNAQMGTTERLQQCQKELECKERREEILKRAIVREQNSNSQLEKELRNCQRELQSLQKEHSVLEGDYKAAVGKSTDSIREGWTRRLPKENSTRSSTKAESLENSEVACLDKGLLGETITLQAQEIARLTHEQMLHREEVTSLQDENTVLAQRLETVQREHEVLLESSSNKISELVSKLGPLSTLNKNQQEEIRSARELNDTLVKDNTRLQRELDISFSRLDSLSRELDALQKENRDLRESLHASRAQETQIKGKLDIIGKEFQEVKKVLEEYEHNNRVLHGEKEDLSTELSKLSTRLEGVEAERECLHQQKEALYEEKQRLILEVSASEDQVERVTEKLKICECERDSSRKNEAKLEAELQISTEKLQETEHIISDLKDELSSTKAKLQDMNNRCGNLEEDLSASKETKRQLLWKCDELQRTLDAVGREAQQNKSFARASLDGKHVAAFRALEDQNKCLQSAFRELNAKMEKTLHENKCLRLEARVNEQFQRRSNPATPQVESRTGISGTLDQLKGHSSNGASPPRLSPRQLFLDSPSSHLASCEGGMVHPRTARSHHTSPDLGIDSDPTPEREAVDDAGGFEEHWQHRMGPEWSLSSTQSAPDAIGGSCQMCLQGKESAAFWKHKANMTYAGEQLEQTQFVSNSPSKDVFPPLYASQSTPGMRLCAIAQLSDHEHLKKRVDESICLIRRVEAIILQALDALADFASDCTEPPECKGLLQDANRGCHSIKVCLADGYKLICSFTISHVPDAKDDEQKQLRLELNKLQEKHSQQSVELQNALEQISSFKEKKEGMERAISRQLSKTKMVLKQTKGNLNVLRSRDSKHEKK